MTRDEVVYHLGAHKTGSSLLQSFLRDSPDVLRRHGCVYLSRSEMNDCVGWGRRLVRRPDILGGRIAELLAEPRHDRVIVSHENTLGPPIKEGGGHLYPRGPETVEQLAAVLRPWRSRVVLYLRPQHEFLESYYLQRIHQGQSVPFREWLEQVDLAALSWRPVVDALREHFGPQRVEVVDFRLIRRGQDAFLADFLRRVDPGITAAFDYRRVRNASLSDKGLRIALRVNGHLRSRWQRRTMRRFLQRYFSNRSYPRPVLLTAEQRTLTRDRYAREYEELTGAGWAEAGRLVQGGRW